jgi:hypothetical protein
VEVGGGADQTRAQKQQIMEENKRIKGTLLKLQIPQHSIMGSFTNIYRNEVFQTKENSQKQRNGRSHLEEQPIKH